MLKKILLLAAFAITPLVLSETASAQCYSGYGHGYAGYGHGYAGYGAYRAPVAYRAVPIYHGHGHGHYRSGYRGYGAVRGYGRGYGVPYYGNSIGIQRNGFSLRVGF